nr:ABC transporter substrate-binding protein [Arsenicicoccus dermatophilus]
MTYIPNVQFAPFYVGIAQGTFARHGVQVEVRHHGVQEGLFTALAAGQEHLVIASGDEVLQARDKGLDLVAVASYYRRLPVVLIVPDRSPIRSAADLRGRSLGVPGRYGASWLGALAMLKDAGVPLGEVSVTEIGYTSQAALATGKVDAVMGYRNNDAVQLRQAGVAIRELPLTRGGEPPLVSVSLVTTSAYAAAHPQTVRAVADAMVEAIGQVKTDPARALQDTKAYVPTLAEPRAAAAARATLDATTPLLLDAAGRASGRLVPAEWTAMSTFMRAQGLIAKDVSAAQVVRTDLVTR